MTAFKVSKRFLFLCVFWQTAESIIRDKWYQIDNSQKFFIEPENKYNWFEDWNECSLRNLTLVAIETRNKDSVLTEILRKNFEKRKKIYGLVVIYMGVNSEFRWSSTGKRFDFSNWSKGNPDNTEPEEHCVHIEDSPYFDWNDNHCSKKLGYICEENRFLLATRRDLAIKKRFVDQLFTM